MIGKEQTKEYVHQLCWRNSSSYGTGTGALAEDTMTQTLTYRGVKYERSNPLTHWMMNEKLKRQREEFELKLDRERMKGEVVQAQGQPN